MDAKTGTTNTKKGKLTLGDKSWSFPLYEGTIGPEVMDISKLYSQTGIFTYDPGFTSTGSCESKITYIDGDKGILFTAAIRSKTWPSTAISSRPAICCFTANCRPRRRRKISTTAWSITPWSTSR